MGALSGVPGLQRQRLYLREPGLVPKFYPVPKPVPISAAGVVKALTAPELARSPARRRRRGPERADVERVLRLAEELSSARQGFLHANPTNESALQFPSVPASLGRHQQPDLSSWEQVKHRDCSQRAWPSRRLRSSSGSSRFPSRAASYAAGGSSAAPLGAAPASRSRTSKTISRACSIWRTISTR